MSKEKKIDSSELNINLASGRESEVFKWFLACLLFGKPIQQQVAKRTYFVFLEEKLTNPNAILKAGWDRLVKVLGKGHYVRFDFSTATKLLDVSKELKEKYGGKITNMIKSSINYSDLERQLLEIKYIGPITARIFIRDLKKYLVPNFKK